MNDSSEESDEKELGYIAMLSTEFTEGKIKGTHPVKKKK